jgi:hypothetical protein
MMEESTKVKWEENQRKQTRLSRHKNLKNIFNILESIIFLDMSNLKSYSSFIPTLQKIGVFNLKESEHGFI